MIDTAPSSRFWISLAAALVMAPSACTTASLAPAPAAAARPSAANPIAPPRPAIDLEQFKIGFRIAVIDCSDCHAIDQKSKSPQPEAPPLRDLLSRYDARDLAAGLIQGAAAGAGTMPAHHLNRQAAEALVVYIRVLAAPSTPPAG